jgi:hypothetical protein
MDNYINNYENFKKKMVYYFVVGDGGIGDYMKFFMFALEICIKNNIRLYHQKNNIQIEKYIKLKYDKMYIDENNIKKLGLIKTVTPYMFYSKFNWNFSIKINEVFYFTDEVKLNSKYLFPINVDKYISIHLRLGDQYLETDKNYVLCKHDKRIFSEDNIFKFIEENYNKTIFFCCDNKNYKLKIKEKYNNIIITNCDIGHTSLTNTKNKQVLDAITELYILTNSEMIFSGSQSGFSIVASKFNNISLINDF